MTATKDKLLASARSRALRDDLWWGGALPAWTLAFLTVLWPALGLGFIAGLPDNQGAIAGHCLTLSGLFLAALTLLMAYLVSDRMKRYFGTTGLRDLIRIFLDAVILSAGLGMIVMLLAISQSLTWAPLSMAAAGIVIARLLRTAQLLSTIMEAHTRTPETLGDILQAEIEAEKTLASHV